ncbi:hypothetical protein [Acuticoccus sediminis]|uniref:PIN-like domain-containing protein n=1 Tax=Acuticoccus sediminis TaxID=2184697 RepID=UPI0011B93AB8|nr:hypothetical protein [Acuticoccus sediminis]
MKIRFDENMSPRIVAALRAYLSSRGGFELSHVREFSPPATGDPTWLKQFSDDDGHAIISGDSRILQNWPDLIAYAESGLVSYWPPKKSGGWNGYSKAALWIQWWPVIYEHMKDAPRGSMWRLPNSFVPNRDALTPLKDPRLDTDQKKDGLGITTQPKLHEFKR